MKLIPTEQRTESGKAVEISQQQQERAGIKLERISYRQLARTIRATGQVILDSPSVITAQSKGTVAQLFANADGFNPVAVRKDEPILAIAPANGSPTVILKAPVTSWVTILVKAGVTVTPETSVISLASLNPLPVIGDIPLNEVSYLNEGSTAEMRSESEPGRVWRGTVTNIYSAFDSRLRTVRAKLLFPNNSTSLRANMPVELSIMYAGRKVLAVPSTAVLWTGDQWISYVELGPGRFVSRDVSIGAQSPEYYEIRSGLKEGDNVVSQAAFLVDSESRLSRP